MKKTEAQIAKLFEEQISFIFDEFKKLPNYGQANPTFIARPRKQDTFEKIRSVLSGFSSEIEVNVFESVGNAHVIRFDEDSRVVIIYAKDEYDFNWLYNYYSYSFSTIIGKIFKIAGLKYSEDGLQYIQLNLRENHKSVIGSINITKDFNKVLEVLELDKSVYEKGFKSIDELFSFIIKSPYFNPSKFINSEKEHRTIFLQKLEEYLILNNVEDISTTLTFEKVKEFFPDIDFESAISKLLYKAEKKRDIYNKLNGQVIMKSIPGFEPAKIGISMGYFKNSFESKESYDEFMMEHSQEEVVEKFKEINQLL